MAAIKYERELLNYLQSCKKKPTTAGIWSAAIELLEEKFTSTNNARDEIAVLANELEDFNSHRIAPYGRITEIVAKMRQLSPVA